MTKFFCTYCGQKLSAKESMLGTFVPCPSCKNSIEVPDFLKPQVNRFATIPLSAPAPPATPGGVIAAPATPVAVIPPPEPPAVIAPLPPEPEPITEELSPPAPAATLPPVAPIPAPASPAAALPPPAPTDAAPPPLPTSFFRKAPAAPPLAAVSHLPAPALVQRKNPAFAAVLSLLLPGLGQMYNGQFIMGLILIPITFLLYPALLIGLFLHIYLICDAYNGAKKINARMHSEDSPLSQAIPLSHTWRMVAIAAAVAAIAILTFVGVVVYRVFEKERELVRKTPTQETTTPGESTGFVDAPLANGSVHFSEPNPNGWVTTKFHRLLLELPATPHTHTSEPPAAASHLIGHGQYDERRIRNDRYQLTILHTTFFRSANLQGAVDGAVNNVSLLPSVSDFDSETEKTTLSGLPIAYVKMRYTMKNEPQLHQSIFLVDGNELWNIHIIGRAKDIPDLWKRIRGSIKIEQL